MPILLQKTQSQLIAASLLNRLVLHLLVFFNLAIHAIVIGLLILGDQAYQALPITILSMLLMFSLTYLYVRWLLPSLGWVQLLAFVALRELVLVVIIGLVSFLVYLILWLSR